MAWWYKEEISYIFYLTCNKEYILNFRYDLCSRNNHQRPLKVRFLITKDFFKKFCIIKEKKWCENKIKSFDSEENNKIKNINKILVK